MANVPIRVPGLKPVLNDARILNSGLSDFLVFNRAGEASGFRVGSRTIRGGQFANIDVYAAMEKEVLNATGRELDDYLDDISRVVFRAIGQVLAAVDLDLTPFVALVGEVNDVLAETFKSLDAEFLDTGKRLLNGKQRKTGRWWLSMEGHNPEGARETGKLFGNRNVVRGSYQRVEGFDAFTWPDESALNQAKHWRAVEYGGSWGVPAGYFYPTSLNKRPNVLSKFYPSTGGESSLPAHIRRADRENVAWFSGGERTFEGKFLLTLTAEEVVGQDGEKFFGPLSDRLVRVAEDFGDSQRVAQQVEMTLI